MKTVYDKRYILVIQMLKEFRLKSNMTQQELAMLLNCDQTYISKYESGQRRLDVIELRTICQKLGIDFISFIIQLEKKITEGYLDD